MDPAPEAGQLRDEAVDTRHGTLLGRHSFPHNLKLLQHAEAPALQFQSSSFPVPGVSSGVQGNLGPGSPYHDHLATEADQTSILNPHPASQHEPSSDAIRCASPPAIDADDFYKNYRGADADTGPDILPMAATSSSRPPLRSNGDGTTPRHPAAVAAQHNLTRANLRSVSSPLDGRSSAGSTTRIPIGKPSVKDLKKRFDQNAVVGVSTIPPPPARAIAGLKPTRLSVRSPVGSTSRSSSNRDMAVGRGGGGADAVDVGKSFLSARQSNFVADDQASGSTQSFASRVGNPRNSTHRELVSHRPITNPQKKSKASPQPITSISPTPRNPQAQGLLFGEILPDRQGREAASLGLGINETRPRGTSEPIVQIASSRQRNLYSPDLERSAPSFHHRGLPSPFEGAITSSVSRPQPPSRAHSDDGSSSPSSRAARHQSWKLSSRSSKLPLLVRKPSSPSDSSSPSSTRSSSPLTLKRYQANGRRARTSPVASRAKTPTPTQTRNFVTPVNSSTRLQAFIASPTPKLSPTLRSSRPRRPVSTASTSGSKMKESDGARSRRTGDSTRRRHKISIGPIDFEQRREHIRLAYSKSIRESEALEARQKADAEKARHELQTLPLPQDTSKASGVSREIPPRKPESNTSATQAAAAPSVASDDETQQLVSNSGGDRMHTTGPKAAELSHGPDASPCLTVTMERLVNPNEQDSPTLGLPGTFPDELSPTLGSRRPLSAVSATSDTTEFDTEPQVNPPIQAASPTDIPIAVVKSAIPPKLTNDEGTTPFTRLGSEFESDCKSELEPGPLADNQRRQGDDAATDTCSEGTGHHEQDQRAQSGDCCDGSTRFYRISTCASSVAGTCDDAHYAGYEQREAPRQHDESSRHNLPLPGSRYHNERTSQRSTWTDFSMDSGDQSAMPSSRESPAYGHVTIFSSQRESLINDGRANTQEPCVTESSRPASTSYNSLHLPEVDTGDGFSIPCFSHGPNDSAHRVSLPNREPPSVPPSVLESDLNSRASSAYYEQSQYGSILLNSELSSGVSISRADTYRSMDSASLATTEQYVSTQTPADSDSKSLAQDGEELTDKERHRLVQRRNVIKELIDTEAVFVRDMNIVEEIYKGTAEACPKLDGKTIKLIFRNSAEIIAFHTKFLSEIKEGVADVYVPKEGRVGQRDDSSMSTPASGTSGVPNDSKDRSTCLGPIFKNNIEQMKLAHEGFLRASDQAAKRLIQIQQDPTVQVWLGECNEVAKDLTAAWDLDSLLIKPMQRITKYPNLIITLLQHTPHDHPDREALVEAKEILETAIIEINKTKKNFELVGQIVGRKRKESDVKAGLARAFGKRVDKLQASNNRPAEDADYAKLHEKFGDDYLRLQVVLRDVEFYTRQVSAYVHEFLQYMSSIELVMRLQPGSYPELESKWVQFNISVRDLEKVTLEEHLSQVRKLVIEPFEHVIKAYGNPSLAMKKRQKRRLDFERCEQLRKGGKSPDPKLKELVEQYDALNDTLKKELPQLSALTEKIGNICLGNFVSIQARWYSIWKDKMKGVLTNGSEVPDVQEVVTSFERDFPYASNQLASIGILNPGSLVRTSISTSTSVDESSVRTRPRPPDAEARSRGQSVNGDAPPILPAPDFGGRRSGSFAMSPSHGATGFANGVVLPGPHQYYYRDYYAGIASGQGGPVSPRSPEFPSSVRSGAGAGLTSTRPSTGHSQESGMPRQSSDSTAQSHRESTTTYNSNSMNQEAQRDSHRFSNMFRSAMPMSDGLDESSSHRESRASSREGSGTADGYNVLWLAASLFEFNIATTKHEAGYPYMTYQAGEIFDVIAEKGELWLARNQDDAEERVGWIWSKHFAKLADS